MVFPPFAVSERATDDDAGGLHRESLCFNTERKKETMRLFFAIDDASSCVMCA